jgi:hypothetical protein
VPLEFWYTYTIRCQWMLKVLFMIRLCLTCPDCLAGGEKMVIWLDQRTERYTVLFGLTPKTLAALMRHC